MNPVLTVIVFILAVHVIWVLTALIFFSGEVKAAQERDPAARNRLEVTLLYPGLHAIMAYRINHTLWNGRIPFFPRAFSQLTRFLTGVEIHPGARIGHNFFIDHGHGVVIGETSVIGNNVTIFQGVTLGGTGKEQGKRHPTIGDNVVIGAGAKILGDITVGSNSYIGANAVIIRNVPLNSTVVGVPGRITRQDGKKIDILMDHIHVLDPMVQAMEDLNRKIKHLDKKINERQSRETT